MTKALIFVHGELHDWEALEPFERSEYLVYCADGAAEICAARGILPDAIIGDLDSIAPATLARFTAAGVAIKRYPGVKDKTDLELTIDEAQAAGVEEVILVAALGGRLDHTLGNLLLCANPAYLRLKFTVLDGATAARRISSGQTLTLSGKPGDIVSLVPLSSSAKGVSTTGLRWALSGADLTLGSSWTLSNELCQREAAISLSDGILLVVHIPAALT